MLTLQRSGPDATPNATIASARETTTRPGITLVQLHDQLWRVTLPTGEVLGYVEQFVASDGLRFRSKRLKTRERRFVVIGEFWAFEEATDCFVG